MKREILVDLQRWKADPSRKPLILMGARQVGKTTVLQQFGENNYDNLVYLNFESNDSLHELFAVNLDPQKIIRAIEVELAIKIVPGKTLIFFDEIQECPKALNSLKYFCEQGNDYHVCAAGSLLGVKLKHTQGFPVGKVNILRLFPLSFSEFLDAINESSLKSYLDELEMIEPLPGNLHTKLTELFKYYLIIGGMPEAVFKYQQSTDLVKVRDVHDEILSAYTLDFAKHAPKSIVIKINLIWKSLNSQLAKENKKFIYSIVRQGARAKDFEEAIQWLLEAGLIHKVYNTSAPKIPLDAYAQFDFFKIYLLDVGLLSTKANIAPNVLLHGDELFQEFRGSLVENYVTQTLAQQHFDLYYWTSNGKAEIDFLVQVENRVLPLEIKSGNSTHNKSLRVYDDKYQPDILIRGSTMNLKQDDKMLNCPLYLLHRIKEMVGFPVR